MTSFCENVARGACENPSRRPTKSELNDAILVYASASEDVMKVPTPVGVNRALDAAQRHVIELLDAGGNVAVSDSSSWVTVSIEAGSGSL